jgi:hypothetical protein
MVKSRRSRTQRGGSSAYTGGYGNYSYTGPAGVAAGGVPFESRAANNEHCGWDNYRHPPQLGGFRRQNGGGCGCGGGLQWGGRSRKRGGSRRQNGGFRRQNGGSRRQNGGFRRQNGGGGGTGGYGFDFGNNALGKVYASLPVGACPPTPVANQLGGASDHELLGIDSYAAGYGFGPQGVVSTNSAHYLDPLGYDRSCKGGARRTKKKAKKAKRKCRQ